MVGKMISDEIAAHIEHDGLIEEADISQSLGTIGYQLRVGSYFDNKKNEFIQLQKGEVVAVAPGGFLLIGTIEKVNFPLDIMGTMYLRASFMRRGFLPSFQGIVDPGYRGQLTIVLHNLRKDLLPITGGERICQIIFERLPAPVTAGYIGTYLGDSIDKPIVKIIGVEE